ncbi:hypothetical protein GCM10011410_21150 [Hoyosella rhizosphaerae]|uniref:TVP38/TMEM64 family membrane protein n=1 Tax=Hoyosella rhizosphaerae TaxID=1755582 RepID=A0A916UDT6_9ACTN|nr:hypothetical protein GCM10011410_21150 [Hoyosella rhizosphaerae]
MLAVLAVLMLDVPGPSEIRAFAESAGPLGLVLFIAIFVGLTLTPVPSSALAVTAGLLYGFVGGALIAVPSAIVAALIAYYGGRTLGADALLHYGKQPALRAVTFLNRRGFTAVLTVRLVPLLPFWLVNYSSGVAGIPVLGYVLATSIGILPGMLGFVAVGAFGTDIFSWQFAATITAVFAFSMCGAYAVQRFTRRGHLTN